MNDFLNFMRMAARTPLLAAALLALAIKDNMRQRRKPQPVEWQDTVCQPEPTPIPGQWHAPVTLTLLVDALEDNETQAQEYLVWYEERKQACEKQGIKVSIDKFAAQWLWAAVQMEQSANVAGEVKD